MNWLDNIYNTMDKSLTVETQFNLIINDLAKINYKDDPLAILKISKVICDTRLQDETKNRELDSQPSFNDESPNRFEIAEKLFHEDITSIINQFSLELENIYVLYFPANYEASVVLHNWNDIKEYDYRISLDSIYNFLNDVEIIPVYLNIDEFIIIYVTYYNYDIADVDLLKRRILLKDDESDDIEDFAMSEIGFYELVNFIFLCGIKILAADKPELFDLRDLLEMYLRNYLCLRTNMEILAHQEVHMSSNRFLKYLYEHDNNIRDKFVITEQQQQELTHYETDRVVSIEMFTEQLTDIKTIKLALVDKLLKIDFLDLDSAKYLDENKQHRVLGAQVPQPRVRPPLPKKPLKVLNNRRNVVKIDPFFKRQPDKGMTHDYKHNYNLYRKLKNDENNKKLDTKELYKLTRLPELMYEIIDIPDIDEKDYIDVIKILHLIGTNQLLTSLKLLTFIINRVEKDKFMSREYLCYLYFTKGIVHLKAQKYDEAMTLFYHCMSVTSM